LAKTNTRCGLETASKNELRAKIAECFNKAGLEESGAELAKAMLLLEAQRYMGELDRRSAGRTSRLSVILEIAVVGLILFEIYDARGHSVEEGALMTAQNRLLGKMESSANGNRKYTVGSQEHYRKHE